MYYVTQSYNTCHTAHIHVYLYTLLSAAPTPPLNPLHDKVMRDVCTT